MLRLCIFATIAIGAVAQGNTTCLDDGKCCGATCDNCCSSGSHQTLRCGQDLSCDSCKLIFKGLVAALQKFGDCSKIPAGLVCGSLPGILESECEKYVGEACDWVLQKVQSGISDPATLCANFGACGSKGYRCGCLPDGACNMGGAEECCSGKQNAVIQATCASMSRCGCRKDGECMAISGTFNDCCSGKRHHTQKCPGQMRCGCQQDGECLDILGGATKDCCSGVAHFSVHCLGGRQCGAVSDTVTV